MRLLLALPAVLAAGWALGVAGPTMGWLLVGVTGLLGALITVVPGQLHMARVYVTCAALVVGVLAGDGLVYATGVLEAAQSQPAMEWLTWSLLPLIAVLLALLVTGVRITGLATVRWGSFPGRLWPAVGLLGLFAVWYHLRFWPVIPGVVVHPLPSTLTVLLVVCGLLVALFDELLFRGLLLSVLGREVGWGAAVVLQALLYGLLYSRPDLLPFGSTAGVAMGLVALYFGFCARRRGGLGWIILLHLGVNGIILWFA